MRARPGSNIMIAMDRYPVTVAGVDLVLEQPGRGSARLLRDGHELPRDRWGNYRLTGADGAQHRPEIGYSMLHLSPTVRIDDRRDAQVLVPLPKYVSAGLVAAWVLGFLGGLLGALLVAGALSLSLRLLRHPPRPLSQIALVVLVWVLLIGLYLYAFLG
ncbi:hypothetical protein KIH74_24160 [Kineosporia sp. J2-2]|uniref:Uncharacterized protein n=1 Tax=Kineosporia corallincola TaxID=2835133 RepID=A0ABS5TQN7_9ACTN|nr:hypothetical protein [Kineosporia corallincola]MBT0772059.1 hypothetical protein [Kineosporia corallincola]